MLHQVGSKGILLKTQQFPLIVLSRQNVLDVSVSIYCAHDSVGAGNRLLCGWNVSTWDAAHCLQQQQRKFGLTEES
jgi:hypothetical protein